MAYMKYFVFLVVILGFVAVQCTPVKDVLPAFVEDVRRSELEQNRNGVATRIVAGWPASDAQIPHQVSIRMVTIAGQVFSCGGSVIHHNWVLTAAHCVANRYSFVVRFGLTNVTRADDILEATRRYIYPGYWEPLAGVQTDDIALVGIDQYITYSSTIQPCRLQPSFDMARDYTGVVLTASGYGMTDDAVNGGTVSETLNWVYLRGISNSLCQQWYPAVSSIQAPTICAEFYNDTRQSSCQGDSGGPLTYVDFDGRPTMVGVASFVSGAGCNSPWPSGWVRPGYYHSWLQQITGLNFDWTISSDGFVNYGVSGADAAEPSMMPITFQASDFGPMKPGLSDMMV